MTPLKTTAWEAKNRADPRKFGWDSYPEDRTDKKLQENRLKHFKTKLQEHFKASTKY